MKQLRIRQQESFTTFGGADSLARFENHMTKEKLTLIVGVTTRSGKPEWISKNTQNYLNTLEGFGVVPVVLSPNCPAVLPSGERYYPDELGRLDRNILDHLHGLILSGGGDVDPKYFGAEIDGAEVDRIHNDRDELELGLSRAALEIDIPLFGICRGCQVLNVAAGGALVQHLDGHRLLNKANSFSFHDVVVTPETRIRAIVGEDTFTVNTSHHQGIDRASIASIFTPSAVATPDPWLVEAFESDSHTWVIGVQWHPERTFELGDPHRKLWESFVAACLDRAIAMQ